MKIYLLNCNYSFIILYFHPHPDTIFWQKAFHFLRPFNEAIISAIEIIFIADVIDFRFGFEAVEVEVIQDPLSYLPQRGRRLRVQLLPLWGRLGRGVVFIHQRKRRTASFIRYTKLFAEFFYESCFSCT